MRGTELYNVMRQTGQDIRSAILSPVEARIQAENMREEKRLRQKQEGRSDEAWKQGQEDRAEAQRLRQKAEAETDAQKQSKERIAKEYEAKGDKRKAELIRAGHLGTVLNQEQQLRIAAMKGREGTKPTAEDSLNLADEIIKSAEQLPAQSLSDALNSYSKGDGDEISKAQERSNSMLEALGGMKNRLLSLKSKLGESVSGQYALALQEKEKEFDQGQLELQAQLGFEVMRKAGFIDAKTYASLKNTTDSLGINLDLTGYISLPAMNNAIAMAYLNPDKTKQISEEELTRITTTDSEFQLKNILRMEHTSQPMKDLAAAKLSFIQQRAIRDKDFENIFKGTSDEEEMAIIEAASGNEVLESALTRAARKTGNKKIFGKKKRLMEESNAKVVERLGRYGKR